jgi:hypothetical protein
MEWPDFQPIRSAHSRAANDTFVTRYPQRLLDSKISGRVLPMNHAGLTSDVEDLGTKSRGLSGSRGNTPAQKILKVEMWGPASDPMIMLHSRASCGDARHPADPHYIWIRCFFTLAVVG